MTVIRFSVGLALFAAGGCAQIPTDAPVYDFPYRTTGASSVSYVPPAPLVDAPPSYAPSAPLPQSRAPYAQTPRYLPVTPSPAAVAPSPVAIAAPVQVRASAPAALATIAEPSRPVRVSLPTQVAPSFEAAPPVSTSPRAFVVAPRYSPAVVSAPVEQVRDFTTRERIAAFSTPEPPLPYNGGRQFRIIENAALDTPSGGRTVNGASSSRFGDVQITTAEPFSIRTDTGKPYYLGSTPPAIEYQIPHIPQEEPLWCWAAAAQQAIGWVNNGRAPAQCAIVALAHGLNVEECCADRDGICARTGEIPAIEKLVERFGGKARELATVPRDPQVIYDILRAGETLLIRLRPAPHEEAVGIRHMIVVRGIEWLRMPNNQLQATLLYNDPLGAGERAVNFDEIEGFFEQALVVSRS